MAHQPNTNAAWLLPLALAVVGCRGGDVTSIGTLPPNTYAAVLGFANEALVGSTGLVPVDDLGRLDTTLSASDDPDRYLVYAFDRATIDRLHGRPEDADLAALPLRLAGPNAPRLPSANWVGGFQPGDPVSPLDEAPDLTAPWLPDCPTLLGADEIGHVSDGCSPFSCDTIARQSGCTIDIETRHCVGGRLRGVVRGDGSVDYEPSTLFGACVHRPTRYEAVTSLECQGGFFEGKICPIDVFARGTPPPFEVTTRPVGDGEPLNGGNGFGARHLGGMAILDGQVAVTRFARPAGVTGCKNVSTELLLFDHDSLLQVYGEPTLDCLRNIRRVPGADRIVGMYNDGDVGVALLEETGEVVATTTVALGPQHFPMDVVVNQVDQQVVLLLTAIEDEVGYGIAFDLETLERVGEVGPFGARPRAATMMPGGTVASVESEQPTIVLARGSDIVAFELRTQCGKGSPRDLIYHPDTGRLIASMRSETQSIFVLDPEGDGTCRRFPIYEEAGEPYALTNFPPLSSLAIAAFDGTDESGHNRSFIAFVDVAEARILPGTLEVGEGPITELEFSGNGTVWGLMAFSDRLAKLIYTP
ncbi:MAG: hypothetical protein RIT81_33345 [Deltaproteobacteria bacterium]